jgi:UPF0755 protein
MDDFKNLSSRARAGLSTNADKDAIGQPPRRSMITRWVIVAGFLVFVIVAAILLARGVDWYHAHSPETTVAGQSGAAKVVTIESGMTAAQIGNLLEEQGVIESSAAFVDLVTERGSENTLHPGKYTFDVGLELLAVVDMLESGTGSSRYKVLVPEGLAISQVKDRLNAEGKISGADYELLTGQLTDFQLPSLAGAQLTDVSTMEGLLFPDTYFLSEGEGPDKLIEQQLLTFTNKTSALPWDKAGALGVTPYQIVIIASLIEKECSVPEERAMVARVIYNRLAQGMTLGIDATVRYAVNKWTDPLTDADLAVDSPFNTRVKTGLPPTPICSPGEATLMAALEPAAGDWLYYVLKDTTGNHFFTSSYEEFLAAKANQPQQ